MAPPLLLLRYDYTVDIIRLDERASVRVTILPSIKPKPDESPLALTDRLMFTLAKALPESMRGVYAEIPAGFDGN